MASQFIQDYLQQRKQSNPDSTVAPPEEQWSGSSHIMSPPSVPERVLNEAADIPRQMWSDVKGLGSMVRHPWDAVTAEGQRVRNNMDQANTASDENDYMSAFRHGIQSVPILGGMVQQGAEHIDKNDYGRLAGDLLFMKGIGKAGEYGSKAVKSMSGVPVPEGEVPVKISETVPAGPLKQTLGEIVAHRAKGWGLGKYGQSFNDWLTAPKVKTRTVGSMDPLAPPAEDTSPPPMKFTPNDEASLNNPIQSQLAEPPVSAPLRDWPPYSEPQPNLDYLRQQPDPQFTGPVAKKGAPALAKPPRGQRMFNEPPKGLEVNPSGVVGKGKYVGEFNPAEETEAPTLPKKLLDNWQKLDPKAQTVFLDMINTAIKNNKGAQ